LLFFKAAAIAYSQSLAKTVQGLSVIYFAVISMGKLGIGYELRGFEKNM
jgi:hypothetical protein